MTRTNTSVHVALAAVVTPTVSVDSETVTVLPDTDTPRRARQQTSHYTPETIKQKARSKTRSKGTKVHIRGFYAVCIDDNTKPKRRRRDRMCFAYRCVVNAVEEDDYSWITLNEMLEHPDEEQFVGCIGESVTDCGSPVVQGAGLFQKSYKKN